MANPGFTKDEANRRLDDIEEFLRQGYYPKGRTPPKGQTGAVRMAAEKHGFALGSSNSFLQGAERTAGRKVDWSLWKEPVEPVLSAPDGYRIKGTSTYVDDQGRIKGQWIKTDADSERQYQIFLETIEGFKADLPKAKPAKAPRKTNTDLMTVIPVGDAHIGMYSWAEETGADYDTKIAERLLTGAADYLIGGAPDCEVGVIALMGDFLHYDSMEAVTPTHKHILDADTRFPEMVRTGVRVARYMIAAALAKFKTVRVIVEIGNHDLTGSIFLAEMLSQFYENEPRLTVDNSPAHFHYYQFGKCLIATHHGHGRVAKFNDLPEIMAHDCEAIWSETKHRVWYTGHIHNKQGVDARTCYVESLRVMPPGDAHATNSGYRSKREMKADIYHREFGRVATNNVTPEMLT